MYIITGKRDNDVKGYGASVTYLENGYPYIEELQTAYIPDEVQILEIDSVPEEVEIGKWCYTEEDGFYSNPMWIEPNPYGIPDSLVEQIKNDAIAEVEEAVLNGTDE